jgi:hypothetical protein
MRRPCVSFWTKGPTLCSAIPTVAQSTPLDLARRRGHDAVCKLLQTAMEEFGGSDGGENTGSASVGGAKRGKKKRKQKKKKRGPGWC